MGRRGYKKVTEAELYRPQLAVIIGGGKKNALVGGKGGHGSTAAAGAMSYKSPEEWRLVESLNGGGGNLVSGRGKHSATMYYA